VPWRCHGWRLAGPITLAAVSDGPFVPDDFDVPDGVAGDGFRLAPLGPEHNDADYVAWTSSIDHIRATPGFEGATWPRPASLDDNLRDLEAHRDDYEQRRGFTYTVLDPDGDVIGCVYIYPFDDPDVDARVRSWVSAANAHLDRPLWETVSDWLGSSWPFDQVAYAPRPPT
jgi:hypothetical protein